MKKFFFVLALGSWLLTLPGCRTKQILIHDIQYRDRVTTDTLKLTEKDSVIIRQKGDTIFKEKYITRFKDRISIKTDSVFKYIEKPMYQNIVKTVQIERKLSWFQHFFIWIGKIFIVVILMYLILLIVKYHNSLKIFIKKIL